MREEYNNNRQWRKWGMTVDEPVILNRNSKWKLRTKMRLELNNRSSETNFQKLACWYSSFIFRGYIQPQHHYHQPFHIPICWSWQTRHMDPSKNKTLPPLRKPANRQKLQSVKILILYFLKFLTLNLKYLNIHLLKF